jgi:TolB-like protein/tetratricopeptide (TPR) repeat protein
MTQVDRWQRAKDVFGAALERPLDAREAFLREACGDDVELRREVDSLLAAAQDAGRFLSAPVLSPAPEPELTGEQVGPYLVLAKAGEGGMGVVYEAEDARLGRLVALKLLPANLAHDTDARARFEREARAASALNHPHICTVHDIGEHDARPFIVMERMRGQTLEQMIAHARPSVERVVELGMQVADALEAAHAIGIVHRDIKPANIFVTEHGEAKVLDFGVAKVAGDRTGSERTLEDHRTRPGAILGTVAYMSPEQVRGEALDGRSDLFSLGVVLYEAVTGRLPFRSEGGSLGETFKAILADAPAPPSSLNPAVPAVLEQVILKALDKDKERRHQAASEMKADLARIRGDALSGRLTPPAGGTTRARTSRWRWSLTLAAAMAALLVAFWLAGPDARGPVVARETRIAVLPFENVGAAEDDYFADGMTDEVRAKLTSVADLAVIAGGSASQYRATTKSPEEIARELGVSYLLTAKVRWQRSGETSRIRVTPELAEIPESGAPTTRWQQTYEADLSDVFFVQTAIATKVAQALSVVLSQRERDRLDQRPTTNLPAYDAFLRGQEIEKRGNDPATQRRAAALYEQAVALDPEFALGWARLSGARSLIHGTGVASAETAEAARVAAERAIALAPELPAAHGVLADYHRLVTHDFAASIVSYEHGLRLAPHDADLLRGTALVQQSLGRWAEARALLERARELDPRSWRAERDLARTLLYLRHSAEARAAFNRGLALAPANLTLIEGKAMTFLQDGDLAGARAVMDAAPKEVDPTAIVAYFANYWELDWVLDDSERAILLRLTPTAFDDDRGWWGLALMQGASRSEDAERVRGFGEEARKALSVQLAKAPDPTRRVCLGLVLAHLGRGAEGVREGERALSLARAENDARTTPHVQHLLALVHLRAGNLDRAVELLQSLLETPYHVTPGWLAIDPNFGPLRGEPRFEDLIGGGARSGPAPPAKPPAP